MPIVTWFGADDVSQSNPKTKTFRVKKTYPRILRKRKRRIERRLDARKAWSNQALPMMKASNIHYEMSERNRGINCGGIGAMHMMVNKLGLADEIDARLHLLKRHLPYHESDHVLNLAYNAMLQGVRLQDIELRRNDEAFLDGLGAERIPDPTTSGDFTRRFGQSDIVELMDVINSVRQRVWRRQAPEFLQEAFIDIDGTIAPTLGQCKGGMALSYKGIWGYAPLIVSVANTNEVLYLLNRPGNAASHQDCAQWIDRAIEVVKPHAGQITLRGDTAFTLTGQLDRWDEKATKFIFGMDAHPKVVELAEGLEQGVWEPLERLPRYEILTRSRRKSEKVKESIVRFKGYQNKVLTGESVAHIDYQPNKCQRAYRLVIVRKNISVQKGEQVLFDDLRYFFYITNHCDYTDEQIVSLANGRCNQENVIEQLKNGVNAMRMPVDDLLSNWAYMVMTSLAWNLKAWFGLLLPDTGRGRQVVRMEFRRFLHAFILIPTQIVRTGRRIIYRIMGYNVWLKDLFAVWERLRCLRFT